jgi:hypothetical protein
VHRIVPLLAGCLLAALALARASGASGPSLPAQENVGIAVPGNPAWYVTHLSHGSTHLSEHVHGATLRSTVLPGRWGIQLATLGGSLTGLSPNGRVLVLSDFLNPTGNIRDRSRFAVVDTQTLAIRSVIALRGDYSVDALSPDGHTLYLIHHLYRSDLTKYQVQAYDLRTERLVPGVIADKSQKGWVMAGWPIARAATRDGTWVYTLYRRDTNYPFVHALDASHGIAVCVGIPADWTTENTWLSAARLKLNGDELEIRTSRGQTRYVLDLKTFQVTER